MESPSKKISRGIRAPVKLICRGRSIGRKYELFNAQWAFLSRTGLMLTAQLFGYKCSGSGVGLISSVLSVKNVIIQSQKEAKEILGRVNRVLL